MMTVSEHWAKLAFNLGLDRHLDDEDGVECIVDVYVLQRVDLRGDAVLFRNKKDLGVESEVE